MAISMFCVCWPKLTCAHSGYYEYDSPASGGTYRQISYIGRTFVDN